VRPLAPLLPGQLPAVTTVDLNWYEHPLPAGVSALSIIRLNIELKGSEQAPEAGSIPDGVLHLVLVVTRPHALP